MASSLQVISIHNTLYKFTDMSRNNQAIEDQLAALRKNYGNSLPVKFAEIIENWRQITAGTFDQTSVDNLHRLAHSLAGSGATFGFEGVSTIARVLEKNLKQLRYLTSAPEPEQQSVIDGVIETLKQVCDEAKSADISNSSVVSGKQEIVNDTQNISSNILIVTDKTSDSKNLAEHIEKFGYSSQVFDIKDCDLESDDIPTINSDLFSCVIINTDTHNKTSIDYINNISNSAESHLPTVIIKDKGDLNSRLEAVRAGSDAYVQTPIDVNSLIDILDRLTQKKDSSPYRILIIDDSKSLTDAYSLFLRRTGMTVSTVNDPLMSLQEIITFKPELILMDMYMPNCSGPELATVIRQQDNYASVPIVFLSAESDIDKQLDAMSLGGDDFLTKPITEQHLVAAVSIRAERYRELRSHMVRDSLTGLLNHTKIEEQLEIEISRASRQNSELIYVMVDIDHFKRVNDSYGHATGDQVIKSLSRLLQQSLRKTDAIGRYGGEEFAIILTDTNNESAKLVMDKIRENFYRIKHPSSLGEFQVSVSCGIASYPNHPDAISLNNAADTALYQAKNLGRNQVVVAEPKQINPQS